MTGYLTLNEGKITFENSDRLVEIEKMHERLMENLKLALNVFIAGDPRMARRLIEEKVQFREMERAVCEAYAGIVRQRSGHGRPE